jgi:hypothetical protein
MRSKLDALFSSHVTVTMLRIGKGKGKAIPLQAWTGP